MLAQGFGHIAVTVPDVYAASADLESALHGVVYSVVRKQLAESLSSRPCAILALCVCETGKGVGFKKRPDEGRMKGLAFALDPDGYWVEIIKRPETHVGHGGYVLNQARCTLPTPPTPTPLLVSSC
jgi:hypothetical protein